MKKINSTQIAKLAGVSRSTISRVVNGYENVPEETRAKVMKVIQENGYYPMLSGQLLAGKKTGTIGFFWITSDKLASNSMGSAFMIHVMQSAADLGHLVLTGVVKNLSDKENIDWVKRIFMQGRIDAGIFVGTNNNEPLVEELIAQGYVVGIFDHFHKDRNEPNRIALNFEEDTSEKVIDYVVGRGHRDIAVIDGNMNRYSCVKRHEGFLRGLLKHNIQIRREWMLYADVSETSGYKATTALLDSCKAYPSVICANNDGVAFGAYKAIEEHGLRVGQDISVIGMDGHERNALITPRLTSFAYDFRAGFHALVEGTIHAIEQKPDNPTVAFMPSTLVEGDSCAIL